jgi:DNA-binding PadR family transcriptional regulator
MNLEKIMSINDLILLSILSDKELTLSEIIKKFRELELEKLPTRTGIYSRLAILSTRKLMQTSWKEGEKLYKSSDIGKNVVEKFRVNLNQFYHNESK